MRGSGAAAEIQTYFRDSEHMKAIMAVTPCNINYTQTNYAQNRSGPTHVHAKCGCAQNQNTSPHDQHHARTPRHVQIIHIYVFQIFQVEQARPTNAAQRTFENIMCVPPAAALGVHARAAASPNHICIYFIHATVARRACIRRTAQYKAATTHGSAPWPPPPNQLKSMTIKHTA